MNNQFLDVFNGIRAPISKRYAQIKLDMQLSKFKLPFKMQNLNALI